MNPLISAKYLKRNITDFFLEASPQNNNFAHAVIIPVCNENDYLPKTLTSLNKAKTPPVPTALILVINNPANCSNDIINNNKKNVKTIKTRGI